MLAATMANDTERKVRLRVRDDLWERVCTEALALGIDPEELARTLLERAIRRLTVRARAA
jgi:antitoxin component of RelBE/YafQ-DinJ toxin-antitoxin module